jgi:DNA-binding transcriptional regulator YiaG
MAPEQSRAARAWLGWSQLEMARRANVSLRTVQAFERGETSPQTAKVAAMRRVVEQAGIQLIFDRTGMPAGIIRSDAEFGLPGQRPS